LRTHIPPSVWLAEGSRAIDTAFELLAEADRESRRRERR
jgi:hypothetical protein